MKIPEGTEPGFYWVRYIGIWRPAHVNQYATMDPDSPWEWRIYPTKFHGWIEIEHIDELGPKIEPPEENQ